MRREKYKSRPASEGNESGWGVTPQQSSTETLVPTRLERRRARLLKCHHPPVGVGIGEGHKRAQKASSDLSSPPSIAGEMDGHQRRT